MKNKRQVISAFSAVAIAVSLILSASLTGNGSAAVLAAQTDTPAKNFITNPGAENGLTGWTPSPKGSKNWFAVAYPNKDGYPASHSGTHYFVPGESTEDELYQEIDISKLGGTLTLSAWMRDYTSTHGDESSLRLEIRDSSGIVISQKTSDIVTKTDKWTKKTIDLEIPKDADIARVILVSKKSSGNVCDSYFDDITLTCNEGCPDNSVPKHKGEVITDKTTGSIVEVVTDKSGKQTGIYRGPADCENVNIKIPSGIASGSATIVITEIDTGSFTNNTTVESVTIPKKITRIRKKAFFNCSSLKKIIIKTKNLTLDTVGNKAFKGINKTASITIPNKKYDLYVDILKQKGITGKNRKFIKK